MIVERSDSTVDAVRRENEMLKDQVADLMEKVKSKADMDDEIMVKVNDKVEEWKVNFLYFKLQFGIHFFNMALK
jgi:hypothetical protein